MVAVGSYLDRKRDFEANRLVALDPRSFRPVEGEQLRLGESITDWVSDPGKELLALGGVNFGQVIFVDPAQLQIQSEILVGRRHFGREVHLVSWPTKARLLGYTQQFGAHQLFPGRAFLVDPLKQDLVKSIPLHGGVMAAAATRRGAAFLVADVRTVGPSRLVLMDTQGRMRTVPLDEITAGFVDPGTAGDSFHVGPAVVSLGSTVYVIAASEPVAAVRIRSGKVLYRSMPGLMTRHLQTTSYPAIGTAGALESRNRWAFKIASSRILVTGGETYPVRGGSHLRSFERAAQIVDLRHWRVTRTFSRLSGVRLAGPILLGRSPTGTLTALSRNGSVLYRRPGKNRSWAVVGTRLVEANDNGAVAIELDIRTGHEIRQLGRLKLWPLDALTWPPLSRDLSAYPAIGW